MNTVSLKGAQRLIDRVLARAAELNVRAVVAVSGVNACPVAVAAMDDSYIASFDIAIGKAYTAVALKMPTTRLKTQTQPGGDLYGIQFTNSGKLVAIGGGEPLIACGRIVGGLGVSGGTEGEDAYLAEYGAQLMEEGWTCS